jgi:hypothetical protein
MPQKGKKKKSHIPIGTGKLLQCLTVVISLGTARQLYRRNGQILFSLLPRGKLRLWEGQVVACQGSMA